VYTDCGNFVLPLKSMLIQRLDVMEHVLVVSARGFERAAR